MNENQMKAQTLAEGPETTMRGSAEGEAVGGTEQVRSEVNWTGGGGDPSREPEMRRQVDELRALCEAPAQQGLPELEQCTEQLGRIAGVAAEAGYSGLTDLCLLFQEGVGALSGDLGAEQRVLLTNWVEQIEAYLNDPNGPASEALVAHLQDPVLGLEIGPEDAGMLLALLNEGGQAPSIDVAGELRAPVMTPEQGSAPDEARLLDELFAGPAEPIARETAWEPAREDEPVPEEITHEGSAGEGLPPGVAELVGILQAELPLMEEPLERALGLAVSTDADPKARMEVLEIYAGHLERFGEAAKAIGFVGLGWICEHTRENLPDAGESPSAMTPEQGAHFREWGRYVADYLASPGDPQVSEALVEMLRAPEWTRPLEAEVAGELRALLLSPALAPVDDDAQAVRARAASADDVSLVLPDDLNQDLLEAMLQELPGQTAELSSTIQDLDRDGGLEAVNVAQRIAHTLKGTGNTVGVRGLASLAHHLEDILVACAKQETLPAPGLQRSLMNAADCLEEMSDALTGAGPPPAGSRAVLQELLDWANRIDEQGLPQGEEAPSAPGLSEARSSASRPATEPDAQLKLTPTARVPIQVVEDLLRLAGESIILSGQVHERLSGTADQARSMRAQLQRMRALGGELEQFIDITDLRPERRSATRSEFDPLEMDRYSELHTMSRMLVELATDAHQTGAAILDGLGWLDGMAKTQERLHRETQDTVLHTRMVPIQSIVPRLQRSVRQACRATGKQAGLAVAGADTMMDSDILDRLVDPLMHLLRNAVDHGIESQDRRVASGKGAAGSIQLDFVREGNGVLVCCQDDGGGLDYAAIRRTAEARHLLSSGSPASHEELERLLLRPNFSTRSEVTQTSGRGIGLDMVYSRVLELGGSLRLISEEGRGTRMDLRVPLTLISTHALLVRAGQRTVAIANRGIEQILNWDDGELHRLGKQSVFRVKGETYPARRLEGMLELSVDRRTADRQKRPVLLVREEMGLSAVLVQDVLENRNVVVKNLGRYIPKLPGILGATILGDGAVVPVLDLTELLRRARRGQEPVAADTQDGSIRTPVAPSVLVVDDSLSARRALTQIMEDSGYQVRAARDGMEAAVLIEGKRPDVVLTDMEMPRMNGIELTTHLRANPETEDLPVIMITSRSTTKHRDQAELAGVNAYLTKPFSENDLLDQVESLRGTA